MRLHNNTLALIVASLSVSACVSVSNEEINQNAKFAINERLNTVPSNWVVEQPIDVESVPWIQSFNDPLLEKLVQEALANNLDLKSAAAGVDSARALAVQAGAALKPTVAASLGGSRGGSIETSAGTGNSFDGGFAVSWDADVWGNIRAGSQAAAASAEAVAADYKFAQYSLAASTIKSYVTAIDAKTQSDIANEQSEILKETLRIVDVQVKNGLATSQDASIAKSDLASSRSQAAAAEVAQRDAVRSLELLLGRYPGAELALKSELPEVPLAPPAGIPSELLERRPDLIASERRVAAAFNTVQQAKTARLPKFSLTGNLGGSSSSLSDVLNPANVAWQLASNLVAPIYSGGALKAEVDIATAAQEQALAGYAQAALTAFGEVERALDQESVILEREKQLVVALEEAQKAYRIAKLRYDAGETDLMDLLSIQGRVISSKSSLAAVRRLAIEQRVNLNLALGGSWDSE